MLLLSLLLQVTIILPKKTVQAKNTTQATGKVSTENSSDLVKGNTPEDSPAPWDDAQDAKQFEVFPADIVETYDESIDFMDLFEFDYGQRAYFGEPCDREKYLQWVDPIFEAALQEDDNGVPRKSWLALQQNYAREMAKDKTLRSLTCQADHLMQCGDENSAPGDHHCMCLNKPPLYDQRLDFQTRQCRAVLGSRCFSPFGFYCVTSSACVQGNTGNCECILSPTTNPVENNCQGLPFPTARSSRVGGVGVSETRTNAKTNKGDRSARLLSRF